MEAFDRLMETAETLLGEGGCSWDRKQTLVSLQRYLIEESHEVIESIDKGDMEGASEELGDLLYIIVFYALLGAKREKDPFTMEKILQGVTEKLIRRHPHVFGEKKDLGEEEVLRQWEEIKKGEKERKAHNGIPKELNALISVQKVMERELRSLPDWDEKRQTTIQYTEEEIGEGLMTWVKKAAILGIDAEGALRRHMGRALGREVENIRGENQEKKLTPSRENL